jgi:hypothetical protein
MKIPSLLPPKTKAVAVVVAGVIIGIAYGVSVATEFFK